MRTPHLVIRSAADYFVSVIVWVLRAVSTMLPHQVRLRQLDATILALQMGRQHAINHVRLPLEPTVREITVNAIVLACVSGTIMNQITSKHDTKANRDLNDAHTRVVLRDEATVVNAQLRSRLQSIYHACRYPRGIRRFCSGDDSLRIILMGFLLFTKGD
jgi:hypothetical protein